MSNLSRVVESGLAVDGWLTLPTNGNISDVHVSLSFTTGVFGQAGDDIRFKLRFRRAELRLHLADGCHLIKSTVAEGTGSAPVHISEQVTQNSSLSGGIGFKSIAVTGSVNAEGSTSNSRTSTFDRTDFKVVSKLSGGLAGWDISAGVNRFLFGSPWKPTERRASIGFSDPNLAAQAPVRATVTCREEDLDFFDIQRNGSTWTRVADAVADRRLVAARQFLKKRLRGSYLPSPKVDMEHGTVGLADVLLTLEWSRGLAADPDKDNGV